MKNKAIQQVQEYARITLSVMHEGPFATDLHDIYKFSFWLLLKVDTGSGVGQGRSQEVILHIYGTCPEMASIVASAIEEQAQKKVRAMELTEALVAFPIIITDLVVEE